MTEFASNNRTSHHRIGSAAMTRSTIYSPRQLIRRDARLTREGYRYIGNRCDELGTDLFRTRLMLRKAVCMRGTATSEQVLSRRTLHAARRHPNYGTDLAAGCSVQTLDGSDHRHRKQMYGDDDAEDGCTARAIVAQEWVKAVTAWKGQAKLYFMMRPP